MSAVDRETTQEPLNEDPKYGCTNLFLFIAACWQVHRCLRTHPANAHFTFDDTLADSGGNGYDSEMIGASRRFAGGQLHRRKVW